MNILQTKNTELKNQIIDLYIEAFSSGQSKQHINHSELVHYIDDFFANGKILVSTEANLLTGALLFCNFKKNLLFPNEIETSFKIESCVYIAELMVSSSHRGKGIGTQLIHHFLETVDNRVYSDAIIRVWDKNIAALHLYKKMGFNEIASLNQTKIKVDNSGTFEMKKIYLHKKLG